MLHETPYENSEHNYGISQSGSSNNIIAEEDWKLTIRKVDAKTDIYCTDFEKQISRLPSNLKFIKKYLYYELLPKVEKYIEDLEVIKETPNYDEKTPIIKPQIVSKVGTQITCMDSFDTHNIKHMRSTKIIYGTITGSVIIYDLESQRIICEKQIGNKSRIEIISTSTIKYYDALISRIAVTVRREPNVYIYTYNHSFTIISQESILNLKEGSQTDSTIQLSNLICNIKFSNDSFFVSLTDYSGGVRIYKFNDVPQTKDQGSIGSGTLLNPSKKEPVSGVQLSFQQGKDKRGSMMPGAGGVATGNSNEMTQQSQQGNNYTNIPILITQVKYKEPENYTIIKKSKEDPNKNQGQNASSVKPNAAQQKNQPAKTPAKDVKNAVGKDSQLQNLSSPLDENNYNLTAIIDEKGNDLTPLLKFSKNHPFQSFVQKKLVFEEKQTGSFASCLVTIGMYIAFQGTNNLKYISLYTHLTENMKSIFKIVKSKASTNLSPDDTMSLGSSLAKREKEYINFLKSKLENQGMVNSNLPNINQQANSNDKNQKLPVKNEKEKTSDISNNNTLDLAIKSEINFNTLFLITFFTSQKIFNSHNNLLGIGMNNGSILVWDAELHVDKFLLQDERADIVSISIDENYLVSGSIDGQVHIYNLLDGSMVYKSYHNAYRNNPIEVVQFYF